MTGSAASGVAAWLRFLEEDSDTGIRAALFRTSGGGEPLGFCFTRIDRHDPSLGLSGKVLQRAVPSLAGSLLRSLFPPPVLILGLAGEIPDGACIDDVPIGRPCRRIEPTGTRPGPVRSGWVDSGIHVRCWATEEPGKESCARRLLDEIMERNDPPGAVGAGRRCPGRSVLGRAGPGTDGCFRAGDSRHPPPAADPPWVSERPVVHPYGPRDRFPAARPHIGEAAVGRSGCSACRPQPKYPAVALGRRVDALPEGGRSDAG